MSSFRDGMVVLLKIVGLLVACFVALLLAIGLWMWHSMRTAEAEARAFCDAVAIGEPITAVVSRAEREKLMASTGPEGRIRFRFPGWGLGLCEVVARDGRVTSRRAWFEPWD